MDSADLEKNKSIECSIATDDVLFGSFEWIMRKHMPLRKSSNGGYVQSSPEELIPLHTELSFSSASGSEEISKKIHYMVSDLIRTELYLQNNLKESKRSPLSNLPSVQRECILSHEAALLGSLQSRLSLSGIPGSMAGTDAVELWDYCYRKVVRLDSVARKIREREEAITSASSIRDKIALLESDLPELWNASFKTGIAALNVSRSIVEHLNSFEGSLSLAKRVYATCDYPMVLVDLLLTSPWVKPYQKFENGSWQPWPAQERLCSIEGSVWIMLLHLLVYSDQGYDLSVMHRRERLLRIRPLISTPLVNQIPPVARLQQFLEELNLQTAMGGQQTVNVPFGTRTNSLGPLAIIDMEPTLFEQLHHTDPIIVDPITDRTQLREIATVFMELYENVLDHQEEDLSLYQQPPANPTPPPSLLVCHSCGAKNVEDRCSGCKKVFYCSRECQVNDWPEHMDDCCGK